MNFLDWLQVTFAFVVVLIGLYIALSRAPRGRVLETTRVAGVGVALLGLSYFVGGIEGPAVETPLFTRLEPLLAVVGLLVVLGPCFRRGARPAEGDSPTPAPTEPRGF